MALTEKGLNALGHVKTYFPTGAFSAADLSSACGEKVFAATLNAIVSNGYLNKLGGSPVMYEAIPNLMELLDNMVITLMFNLLGNCQIISKVVAMPCSPTSTV